MVRPPLDCPQIELTFSAGVGNRIFGHVLKQVRRNLRFVKLIVACVRRLLLQLIPNPFLDFFDAATALGSSPRSGSHLSWRRGLERPKQSVSLVSLAYKQSSEREKPDARLIAVDYHSRAPDHANAFRQVAACEEKVQPALASVWQFTGEGLGVLINQSLVERPRIAYVLIKTFCAHCRAESPIVDTFIADDEPDCSVCDCRPKISQRRANEWLSRIAAK